MTQLNNLKGYVVSVPSATQIKTTINTSTFDPFVVPMTSTSTVAQVAGIGDSNTGNAAPGGTLPFPMTVPGAFENQPPE